MDVIHFKDIKSVPDIVHTYTAALRESGTPIIINNGSYQCRAGWASEQEPLLQFKNFIAKPRKERSKKDQAELPQTRQLLVGNDINIEAMRFQLKTPFDRNVVTHFEAQEHLMDYTFSRLGIDTDGCVAHPIVLSEPFLNPPSTRSFMSELMFECYNVPALSYGVDSLFAFQSTVPRERQYQRADGLIVSIGNCTVHVVPVLGGRVYFANARRINTGAYNVIAFLHRMLQLKYPAHVNAITLSRAEELVRSVCRVALDYREEVVRWADVDYYHRNIVRVQLPFAVSTTTTLTAEQQRERKRELARRLTEINARKREERLAEDEDRLQLYLEIEQLRYEHPQDYQSTLREHNLRDTDDLYKNITLLHSRIEKTRQRIETAATAEENAHSSSTSGETPAAQSTPQQQLKPPAEKKPKLSKMVFENEKAKLAYVQNAKKMKQELLLKKSNRRQRKQDMAKRRTAAGQERMRIISQLAKKEKGNDDFGMRDEDWDIYKAISKDGRDSDSDNENEKLLELDEIIRVHDPDAAVPGDRGSASGLGGTAAQGAATGDAVGSAEEAHQLHIGIERYRAVELLFKPHMIGSAEAGLAETVAYVLSMFDADEQLRLAGNVLLDGGMAALPGIRERLSAELLSIRPFESFHKVTVLPNPSLAGWYGARLFANSSAFDASKITRADYEEYGGEFLRTHFASNPAMSCSKNVSGPETDATEKS